MCEKTNELTWKCNTHQLLKEIADCAIPTNGGILKVPLNIFQALLAQVAKRCTELHDPVLDKLMCDLAMYEEADPYSKEYNKEMLKIVEENYQEYLKSL